MDQVTGLKCTLCGELYRADEVEYVCPRHGAEGILDVQYDYDLINQRINENGLAGRGLWRYKALMPIDPAAAVPPLSVGDTPLYRADRVARAIGVREVWLKDEGRNPTASLKDRSSALIVARAMSEGREVVTTASSGNAAAALAGLAVSVGLPTVIFVPASTPLAKIVQLYVYGATVMLVEGTYDDAFDLCLQVSEKFGWYCRNTGYNPYTAEGKKTVSYEICEQLSGQPGEFTAPDRVFVSVGDGNIISGVHKGFKDLLALSRIERMPKIMGVQAEGSGALYNAWKDRIDPMEMEPIQANTIADSISSCFPRDRVRAMQAVTQTGGAFIGVSDQTILSTILKLARQSGVFAEPAAAAAYAGLLEAKAEGQIDANEKIVVLITGNGLKDVAAVQKMTGVLPRIRPELSAVEQILAETGLLV